MLQWMRCFVYSNVLLLPAQRILGPNMGFHPTHVMDCGRTGSYLPLGLHASIVAPYSTYPRNDLNAHGDQVNWEWDKPLARPRGHSWEIGKEKPCDMVALLAERQRVYPTA